MPPAGAIIAAAVSAAGAAVAGTTVFGLGVLASSLVIGAGSLALGTVSSLLAPKPRFPNFAPLEIQAADRTRTVRQAIAARRIIYGEGRFGGPIVFVEASNSNQSLHLIVVLAEGPVARIGTVYFGDNDPIVDANLDANGFVVSGKYSGKVRIVKHLGDPDQAADASLRNAVPFSWTDKHRLRGVAYLVLHLESDADLFPNGIPNITAWVQGRAVLDPRDSQTRWTANPALIVRDYLTDTRVGLGAAAAEIDDTFTNAAANVCDEMVDVDSGAAVFQVHAFTAATNVIEVVGNSLGVGPRPFITGDKVQLSSDGGDPVPAGLAFDTDYFLIRVQEIQTVNNAVIDERLKIQFAATLTDAHAGTAVAFTTEPTGSYQVKKFAEPRYTANGLVQLDRTPREIIDDLVGAMAGRAVQSGFVWRLYAGAYAAPTVTLDEDHLRGPVEVQTRHSRRDRFNGVKGLYVSETNNQQPSDYPAVVSEAFKLEDGRRIMRDLDLPFTNRPQTARRIAKIALLRHRQEISAKFPCTLAAFQVIAGENVALDNARYGWSGKAFEIANWSLVVDPGAGDDAEGAPFLGVDLELRETAAAVYDWDFNIDEQVPDPAPNTNLPDAFNVGAPGAPGVAEDLVIGRAGGGVKARATVSWDASADGLADLYVLESKLSSESDWRTLALTPGLTHEIVDIAPGLYDFRVKARNALGVSSAYSTNAGIEVLGLAAPPADITGLTISAAGGLALLRWDLHPDLDVREGGKILVRHAPDSSGADWHRSVSIGEAVAGGQSSAALPLKPGSYLVKAEDSSGIRSDAAAVVTTAQVSLFNLTSAATVTEHSGFAGGKTNVVVDGGDLKLAKALLIDDWPDVDAVPDVDAEGGLETAGTYDFASDIDLVTSKRVRLTSHIAVTILNEFDTIDARTELIDDWESFDGLGVAPADARVEVRHTPDDPGGSPTWSAWERLDAAEFEARGFDLRAQLTTNDPVYNVLVSELSVAADEVV